MYKRQTEPSLGLAPIVVREIFDISRTVNQQGITVLLNEQNANMALKVADYAYVLETGTLTLSGTGAELLTNEPVSYTHLDVYKRQTTRCSTLWARIPCQWLVCCTVHPTLCAVCGE